VKGEPAQKPEMPAIPPQMIVPLDVAAIAVTVLLGVLLLVLWDWMAALAALTAGAASWLHLHLLVTSFNRFGRGGIALHLLWMIVRLLVLGGIIIGLLLLLPGNALPVAMGVVLAASAGSFGLLFGIRRINRSVSSG
jgi:hypothetical protein